MKKKKRERRGERRGRVERQRISRTRGFGHSDQLRRLHLECRPSGAFTASGAGERGGPARAATDPPAPRRPPPLLTLRFSSSTGEAAFLLVSTTAHPRRPSARRATNPSSSPSTSASPPTFSPRRPSAPRTLALGGQGGRRAGARASGGRYSRTAGFTRGEGIVEGSRSTRKVAARLCDSALTLSLLSSPSFFTRPPFH